MVILENKDIEEDDIAEEPAGEPLGEESMDKNEEDMTSFGGGFHIALEIGSAPSFQGFSSAISIISSGYLSNDLVLAKFYAQEYKARNRVREIKTI